LSEITFQIEAREIVAVDKTSWLSNADAVGVTAGTAREWEGGRLFCISSNAPTRPLANPMWTPGAKSERDSFWLETSLNTLDSEDTGYVAGFQDAPRLLDGRSNASSIPSHTFRISGQA